jgi:hypothetical protein
MINPFTSGSAPGRAQPADRRPVKPGHEKRGGRNRGTPNFPRTRLPIWPIPTGMNALSILAARRPFSSGIRPKRI